MAWIKRNLYFLIALVVALGLLGYGGYYLYSAFTHEGEIAGQIKELYGQWDTLNKENPHPGSKSIDNIKLANEQEKELRKQMEKTAAYFQRIAPIPDVPSNKVSNAEFAAQLRTTVAQLHREAEQASVILPRDYYFTFEAQRRLMIFDSASLPKLATSLGEIREICNVLYEAKVNSLDSIRREMISTNDDNPPDYFARKTESTPLADMTPYEVNFRCFSAELAGVLSGFGNSPHGFIVKTINVAPAAGATLDTSTPGYQPIPPQPTYNPTPMPRPPVSPGVAEANRYGPGGGFPPPVPQPAPAPVPAAPSSRPTTFLNERQLQVTLVVEVIKLKSAK